MVEQPQLNRLVKGLEILRIRLKKGCAHILYIFYTSMIKYFIYFWDKYDYVLSWIVKEALGPWCITAPSYKPYQITKKILSIKIQHL